MTLARLRRIGRHRLRAVLRKDAVDEEAARELAFHHEALVAEHVAAGLSLEEARCAASRALGNAALIEEQCRDQRRVTWLHDLRQDTTHALRMLGSAPGFTIVSVASLALGIGSAAALIAVIDAVVRQPLPFPDADRVVVIRTAPHLNPSSFGPASLPDYVEWRQRASSFEAMAASIADNRDFLGDGVAAVTERVAGQRVSPSLFAVLRVSPLAGRVFTEEDLHTDPTSAVMVISYRFWQARFGGDPAIVGRTIRVSGGAVTVIGVMPVEFAFPDERSQFWAPLRHAREQLQGGARFFQVTARLAPAVPRADAERDVASLIAQLARAMPARHQDHVVQVVPLRDHLFGWTALPLRIFGVAVALVLMLACANVTGLLLARDVTRAPELAMRVALGASRGRLVRQLMAETLVLSAIGAVLGMTVTHLWIRSIPGWAPPVGVQRPLDVSFDVRVVVALIVVMALATVVIGVIPAVTATRRNLIVSFRTSALRDGLVSAQVAIAVVLLIGSTLLLTSFQRLTSRELHFDARGLVAFNYNVPPHEYQRLIGSYRGFPYYDVLRSPAVALRSVLERIQAVPGVSEAAGLSHPIMRTIIVPEVAMLVEGRAAPTGESERLAITTSHFVITPGLFPTLRTPILSGRDVSSDDTAGGQWVAVINEAAARRFWPGADAIGKRFTLDTVPEERPREVVGIVPDIPLRRAEPMGQPVVYTSYLQQPSRYRGPFGNMFGQMTFVVRGGDDVMALARTLQRAIAEVDPDRPLSDIRSVEADMDWALNSRRIYILILVVFAIAATLLAAMGTYGVMAYTVSQRTREIGIRMALGANMRRLLRLVGGRAMLLIAVGVTAGVMLATAFGRVLESQLYGVTSRDPAIYTAVCLLLIVVAIAACVPPARRALAVDPGRTLREN